MDCIECKQPGSERNGKQCHVKANTYLIGSLCFCDICYVSFLKTGYKRQERPVILMATQEEKQPQPKTQEALYDEYIQPLMEKVAEFAEEHNIPFVAVFQRNEDFMRTFSHLPDGTISELHEAGYAIGVYQYN